MKNKTSWSLSPTSNMSRQRILRSHYVVFICSNLISAPDTNCNPVEFSWNLADSVLITNKCIVTLPEMSNVTCDWKMSMQQIWFFMHSILQVQRRMLYLSLLIDSVGKCIRYTDLKVFSEPKFPIYRKKITNSKFFS